MSTENKYSLKYENTYTIGYDKEHDESGVEWEFRCFIHNKMKIFFIYLYFYMTLIIKIISRGKRTRN
jgi:hypothetical protein